MNLQIITKRALGTSERFMKKHGPDILTAAGIAGFGITTVLVGKAVLKSQDKGKNFKLRTEEILTRPVNEEFTKRDQQAEMARYVFHDGLLIVRDFAPAILTGAASVACILAAHGMLKRQRVALLAAYTALDTSFRAYRERVAQKVGPEEERALYRGVRMIAAEDPDTGQPCEIIDFSDHHPSPYAKFFDEGSQHWSKTAEYNLFFLSTQQRYANDLLHARGHVFLNEIYDNLGIPRTQAGQIVGWLEHGDGDGFISFGFDDLFDENKRAFVNGLENVVLLDFNVDGPITID